jgi:glyoxylase-like metal-dependent hydrolase (beta-lactamase superfamily II)
MSMVSRRRFLGRGGAAALAPLALSGPRRARAADRGPPVKDHPVARVSEHVFVVRSPDGFPTPANQGMMANVTFIVGRAGVLVFDSGGSVQIGEMAIRALRTVTGGPVVGVVNSHYHGDHWLGNHAFRDAYGTDLPFYALAGARKAIEGAEGTSWLEAMERWTDGATAGTSIVPPTVDLAHGSTLSLGDVTLRMHHHGVAHTPWDLCMEVVEDRVMCAGDVLMDRRIANIEDGSYLGTFRTLDALAADSETRIWLPAHGEPGPGVLGWHRDLFEGIYESCLAAVRAGKPLEEAKAEALNDPRVASRAAETDGWASNIGKYVSLAYLEAEQEAF